MTLNKIFVTIIAVFQLIAHSVIFVLDYSQIIPLLDFVTRYDGQPSDPKNLLPLERIYAAVTAMAMGTIAVAFGLAMIGNIGTIQGAAALSVWLHGVWAFHLLWQWDTWNTMMHPKSDMTPQFFLITHIVWMVMSFYIVIVENNSNKNESKPKKG